MRLLFALTFILLIAGCRGKAEPSVAQIEEGYVNVSQQHLDEAIAHFGSEDAIPGIALGMIKMTTKVENPVCEKNPTDLGYLCVYNITLINTAGKALDPVNDIKARVWQGPNGWMVHELEE